MDSKGLEGQNHEALGYIMPKSYEELRAVLSSTSAKLPKQLKRVAIVVWQHPSEVALGTVSSVAELAGVQPSTVVRFAQLFQYAGFSDFQRLFKAHIKTGWPGKGTKGANPPAAGRKRGQYSDFVTGLAKASMDSLSRIDKEFDTKSFDRAVALIGAANLIYLIGSKRAFPVTSYMSLTLSQLGIKNVLVDNVGSMALDQIGCVTKADAVIAVSFSPYNSITPDVVALARDRHAKIVSITDSALSPLVGLSNTYLEVIEASHAGFRSLSATTVVGMALVLAVARQRSSVTGVAEPSTARRGR
jgi:DNA-binding MurR/RpiR family transcriptional regulator